MTERVNWEEGSETYHTDIECRNYSPTGAPHVNADRSAAETEGLSPCSGCVDRVSPRWRRRGVLGAVAGALAGMIAYAPIAHDEAALRADISVTDTTVNPENGLIYAMDIRVQNKRDEPISPIVIPWGRGQQSQLPWPVTTEPAQIDPWEVKTIHAELPDRARGMANMPTGTRISVRVFDRGTEKRAGTELVVNNPHGKDSADRPPGE
jgi:hypothetical protein